MLPDVLGAGCKHPFISMASQLGLLMGLPDGGSGCWEPVGCVSLLHPFWDPLLGSPVMVFYAAK